MSFSEWVMQAFINFFGITQPESGARKKAAIFICSLLGLVVLVFIAFFVIVRVHVARW
jgi:hypothetical protein